MPTIFTNRLSSTCTGMIMSLVMGLSLSCTAKVSAQETRVYSFEPDLEGFYRDWLGKAL